ncbi:MAG: GAF domain-containing protein, partial [Cytophagales bacterium]|nr:GAF domain-containing protein [Cytophagales bacterium]
MLSRENIIRIVVSVNIVSWLLLLGLNLITLLQGDQTTFGVPVAVRGLLLNLFLVLVFFYFSTRHDESAMEGSFIDQLVKLLDVGWVLSLISIVLRFADFLLDYLLQIRSAQMSLFFYHLHIGLVTILLTRAFFVWKNFVLYQRSRRLRLTWQVFEYMLLASLFFNFFRFDTGPVFYVVLAPLAVLGIIMAFNLKWVAYLDVRDKWKAILITFLLGLFCAYFYWNLTNYSRSHEVVTDLSRSVYILTLFVFVGGYSVLAFAVLLFNLPTSVVFERKIEELLDFQRFTQTFQSRENEVQVYQTLLETTARAADADVAWLIVANENRQITHVLTRNLSQQQALAMEKRIVREYQYTAQLPLVRNLRKDTLNGMAGPGYRSVLLMPLQFQDKTHGTLGMLKTEKDGFSTDNVEFVGTFARMTGVAIENFRLVSKVIENERYQESLNIARKVQQKLLPTHFAENAHFEAFASSQSGDEVGGD